jgi:hypothetical protein
MTSIEPLLREEFPKKPGYIPGFFSQIPKQFTGVICYRCFVHGTSNAARSTSTDAVSLSIRPSISLSRFAPAGGNAAMWSSGLNDSHAASISACASNGAHTMIRMIEPHREKI